MKAPAPVGQHPQTFPALFFESAKKFGEKTTAIREKDYGIWQSYSWKEAEAQVTALASGLAALGFRRGDRACIVGDNRPHLYWAMLSVQCLGGVPVPLYQDSIEREMVYIVDHAEARFAIVEDQEQADKMINLKDECATLEHVVYVNPRGMRNYEVPYLKSYAEVQHLGTVYEQEHPQYVQQEVAKCKSEDLAIICYTSGTTGKPKGVMLTHANFVGPCFDLVEYESLNKEVALAYLPMAWVGDFFLSFALSTLGEVTVNCPESGATVIDDMREVGPTFFFAPPRIFENLLTSVMIRMDDAASFKKKGFHYFIQLAKRLLEKKGRGEKRTRWESIQYAIGELLVYAPLRDRLGMSRVRIAITAGEAIGPEIFDFFRSIGINLKQLYGSTEAGVFISLQQDGEVRSDTCGPPMPWVDLKIADNGEVLFKSPGLFKGYYKNEQATKESFDGGYYKTGDAGFLDHEGHLKIIDRVKDVTHLQSGTMFAPKYIENKLKFSPFIKEAVSIGQDRPYVTAMLNIDFESIGNWAERKNIAYTGYTDLAQKQEVYELIHEEVNRVNQSLEEDEQLRNARIHRFLILHKELDPDDDEITRTRKIRRGFIAEKYKDLIDGMYGDVDHVTTEAKLTFEDGRTATVKADLRILKVL